MSNKKPSETADTLEDLSPMSVMPYALHVPNSRPWEGAYRRYSTKAHRASAIKGLHLVDPCLYTFNFKTNEWEQE